MLNDEQLLRYSRQIMLPQLDIAGQQALLDASVLIIGAGGLGCPAAMYLGASGVGKVIINDFDEVELSNLQRQIAHGESDISTSKAVSLKNSLQALNSSIEVDALTTRLSETQLLKLMEQVDVVLDCSDNFETRHLINKVCVKASTPLVSGAAIGFDGQVSVFDPRDKTSPCYHCLYPSSGDESLSCAENGVLSPVVGIVGAVQALEAVKLITGTGESLAGVLLIFDALKADWRRLKLNKDSQCLVCAGASL